MISRCQERSRLTSRERVSFVALGRTVSIADDSAARDESRLILDVHRPDIAVVLDPLEGKWRGGLKQSSERKLFWAAATQTSADRFYGRFEQVGVANQATPLSRKYWLDCEQLILPLSASQLNLLYIFRSARCAREIGIRFRKRSLRFNQSSTLYRRLMTRLQKDITTRVLELIGAWEKMRPLKKFFGLTLVARAAGSPIFEQWRSSVLSG
jgi:hypothetical protein